MKRVSVMRGDITTLAVDAIVNAANSALAGGGGVDGAIHRAAGPRLLEACRRIGGCPTGSVVLTPGYDLKAKHVIHAVGPVWQGGRHNEDERLASCYAQALRVADQHGVASLAFPAISCGVYGFPVNRAADIATRALRENLPACVGVTQVLLVAFDAPVASALQNAIDRLLHA